MKRFLVGLIVGICVMLPIHAIADSMVGKQVDMIAPVKLDGDYLDVEAIGIKGTTYAPVRALAESLGKDVDWIDGEVIIETPETDSVNSPADTPSQIEGDSVEIPQPEGYSIEEHIASLEDAISRDRNAIETIRTTIDFTKSIGGSDEAIQTMEDSIARMEAQIAEFEQILDELRAKQTE